MIDLAPEVQASLIAAFWHAAIVFFRVSALVSVLPAFGERSVPARVKIGLALMFTLIVSPAVSGVAPPPGPMETAGFIATEAVIGLALGIGVRLFVLALHTAGSIAAQSTSLAQVLGGAAVEPIPAMGYVLVVAGLALAVMSGLHVQAAKLLIHSYDLFPPGRFPGAQDLSAWGVSRVSEAFALAFRLAAPFVIASLIYNLTLGVINRAMPQLMVAFVGAPVITWAGLFLLFVSSPMLLTVWSQAMSEFMANPAGPIR